MEAKEMVLMPKKLTAEDGYKALLRGEFFESITISNPLYCGCGECDICEEYPEAEESETREVPISWETIKRIYEKIVNFNE